MEVTKSKEFTSLGTKAQFNSTLRHIVSVTNIIDAVDKGGNLADILTNMLEQDILQRGQSGPIIAVSLVNKFNYPYVSMNLTETINDFEKIIETFTRWNNVQMVMAYHHPNLGLIPINPANEEHWAIAVDLKKDELCVIYARTKDGREDSARKAIAAMQKLLQGESVEDDSAFIGAKPVAPPPPPPAAAPAAAPAGGAPAKKIPPKGKRNLTPKYSVQVSNELFHNGNVEAWKNIIESYENSHPECNVIVYHEGELIQDLNSLFKWGKVKHGGLLFFQVAGTQIKGVSRLQKYLYEGASARYETFMKHDVNKALTLF